ncbi:PREDICTED: uncharacterized protein C1orf111 homolog [Eurypyga helias]|uniref:uncharacterized protein C1orf111 homolog n=1 Tax=Eurypyga helias TaxID=54383 RepID=UPI0005285963|nr:PREDICTED: uncharacterized protein C1orf111 homolog [Eurypyga helias]
MATAPLSLLRHSEGLRADRLRRGLAGHPPAWVGKAPQGSELPAHACTVYRPWFSPYSYFMRTEGDTQQHKGGPPSGLATGTWEREEPDDLSEITHIQHSSQEGYSCKVYYRKLKALWEKEQKQKQEAAGCRAAPPAGQPPRGGTAPSLPSAAE